jgi:hypothetical protein
MAAAPELTRAKAGCSTASYGSTSQFGAIGSKTRHHASSRPRSRLSTVHYPVRHSPSPPNRDVPGPLVAATVRLKVDRARTTAAQGQIVCTVTDCSTTTLTSGAESNV